MPADEASTQRETKEQIGAGNQFRSLQELWLVARVALGRCSKLDGCGQEQCAEPNEGRVANYGASRIMLSS